MRRSIVQVIKSLVFDPEAYGSSESEGFNFILSEFEVFEQFNSKHVSPRLLITEIQF